MDIFTHMFTKRKIVEDSKKEKPSPPPPSMKQISPK